MRPSNPCLFLSLIMGLLYCTPIFARELILDESWKNYYHARYTETDRIELAMVALAMAGISDEATRGALATKLIEADDLDWASEVIEEETNHHVAKRAVALMILKRNDMIQFGSLEGRLREPQLLQGDLGPYLESYGTWSFVLESIHQLELPLARSMPIPQSLIKGFLEPLSSEELQEVEEMVSKLLQGLAGDGSLDDQNLINLIDLYFNQTGDLDFLDAAISGGTNQQGLEFLRSYRQTIVFKVDPEKGCDLAINRLREAIESRSVETGSYNWNYHIIRLSSHFRNCPAVQDYLLEELETYGELYHYRHLLYEILLNVAREGHPTTLSPSQNARLQSLLDRERDFSARLEQLMADRDAPHSN